MVTKFENFKDLIKLQVSSILFIYNSLPNFIQLIHTGKRISKVTNSPEVSRVENEMANVRCASNSFKTVATFPHVIK